MAVADWPQGDCTVESLGAAGLDALASDWDALAITTGADSSSRPGWLRAWWDAFGKGRLRLFAVRRGGELTGVLPLAGRGGRLYGCANIHSPLFEAVAADEGDLDALLAAALTEAPLGIVLGRLEAGGPLAAGAERAAKRGLCRLLEVDSLVSSTVEPTVSWEEFEAGMRKKRRSDVRRVRRRLEKMGDIRFTVIEGDGRLDPYFDDFLRFEANTWKVARGTAIRQSESVQRFYREMVDWAAKEGVLRLCFTGIGERPIAVGLMIESGTRRWALKSGYDERLTRSAPGLIHLLEDVRTALEDGRRLELGTGEEPLKRELRNATWRMSTVGLFPRSAPGGTARLELAARMRVYRWVRRSGALRNARDKIAGRRTRDL